MSQPRKRQRESAEPQVLEFAALLRDLQNHAGNPPPSVHKLEELTEQAGKRVPHATIDEKFGGVTAPKLDQLLAIVAACRKYATENRGDLPAETAGDDWEGYWTNLFYEMQRARRDPRRQRYGAARVVMPQSVIRGNDNDKDAAIGSPRLEGLPAATMKRLVTYLEGFHTDQQLPDNLSATLVELDGFLEKHGITDGQVKMLINRLAEQLDDPFTRVSTTDVLDLRSRLASYLAS